MITIVPDARLPFDVRLVRNGQVLAKVYGIDAKPNTELANELVKALTPKKPATAAAYRLAEIARTLKSTNEKGMAIDFQNLAADIEAVLASPPPEPDDIAYCIGCGTHPKGPYTCATCVAADEHEGPQAHVSDWPESCR